MIPFEKLKSKKWVRSSVVEHGIADPGVTGSNPVTSFVSPTIRHGVVGNISACHAEARGSIPRVGAFCPPAPPRGWDINRGPRTSWDR